MARTNLYIQDSKSKRFLQSANTMDELKASKNTIIRWNNEMGYPPPEKGAQLLIENVSVLSTATFGATRLRWQDTDSAAFQRSLENAKAKRTSVFQVKPGNSAA